MAQLFTFVDGQWDPNRRAAELDVLYDLHQLVSDWHHFLDLPSIKIRFTHERTPIRGTFCDLKTKEPVAEAVRQCLVGEVSRAKTGYPGAFIFEIFTDLLRDPDILLTELGARQLVAALRATIQVQTFILALERFLAEAHHGTIQHYLEVAVNRGDLTRYEPYAGNVWEIETQARALFSDRGPRGGGAVPPAFRSILKRALILKDKLELRYDVSFLKMIEAVTEFTFGKSEEKDRGREIGRGGGGGVNFAPSKLLIFVNAKCFSL